MELWVTVVLTATSAFAVETLKGRVVKVADGDTITLLDAANVQHRIRLDKIDAPEKSQPFGTKCGLWEAPVPIPSYVLRI